MGPTRAADETDALTLSFAEIGPHDLGVVGGKGANLGALSRAGLAVPPGFCITTRAFRLFVAEDPRLARWLDDVDGLAPGDVEAARRLGAAMREPLAARPVPAPVRDAVMAAWRAAGEDHAYAVRSSATSEDLPEASFAGQHDTSLNVCGEAALLDRVRACWASLYTDRAILYRLENRIPARDVALAVVVQRMVRSEKSGILFTADPGTGHRFTTAIDAGFGLGEALVSGLITADNYKVDARDGRLIEATIDDKSMAIRPRDSGGTVRETLSDEQRRARVLNASELTALVSMGRDVARLQGCPQDIEWCFEDGALYVVQARPITALYPLPDPVPDDGFLHISFCVNHFQVMTDAMPPLALATWRLMLPLGKRVGDGGEAPWVQTAGGRVFADMSRLLRFPPTRHLLLRLLGGVDRLAAMAIEEVASRPAFAKGQRVKARSVARLMIPRAAALAGWLLWRDPAESTATESRRLDEIEAEVRPRILEGPSLAARLRESERVLSTLIWRLLYLPPKVLAGLLARILLRRLMPRSDADFAALGRGLSGNVTTEMGLAVGDLADVARRHAEVRACLIRGGTREDARAVAGGEAFYAALDAFLARYGMRCPSEIDISRRRWREAPSSILRTVAGNLLSAEEGGHRAHHARLAALAEAVSARLIDEAGRGALGWLRRPAVRRLVRVHREHTPLREHPKFMLVRVLDLVRRTVVEAGDQLRAHGQIDEPDDVWFLEFAELTGALDDGARPLRDLVAERRAAHKRYQRLYPPRVLTSEGESPVVHHATDALPDGALAGTPVSAGVVEGPARIVLDPDREVLKPGEILIAPFTDPGWTPLFLNAAGLVMEVGGLMTHGSVVAREYGIPAVVCVPKATKKIQTGQRVRVDGDLGYVEMLGSSA